MQLTEHKPGKHHFIRSTDSQGVLIGDTHYTHSLIVGARLLNTEWPVRCLENLSIDHIEPLILHHPEVVILGVGQQQSFPNPDIQAAFLSRHIGLECMTLVAAARTFNVLMSENRRAIAALILPGL